MTVKYEDTRAIALTVGEMLDLANALYDAVRYNEKGGFPSTALSIRNLQKKIAKQTDPLINEADAFVLAEMTKKQA